MPVTRIGSAPPSQPSADSDRSVTARHLLLILAVSAAWEWLFLEVGLNKLDEGWTLYAAKRLHEGATLYRDIQFPFPPGHLFAAWLGYGLAPPGVVAARVLYAAFSVGAALCLYLLGRRVMPAHFALLGALLLAIAAPRSHLAHLLFGYRYVVFALLALIAFARRAEGRGAAWMFVAGLCAGVALVFRLTPAATASVAIAVGIVLVDPRPRIWFRDGGLYAAGLLLVALPVAGLFAAPVGLETLWSEVMVRPIAMTDRQSLPIPELAWWPGFDRWKLRRWFVALQFRLWALLYIGYGLMAARIAWRALRSRTATPDAILVTIVVFGASYFFRALGRSDEPHLDSALPPVCLLLAHLLFLAVRSAGREQPPELRPASWRVDPQKRRRVVAAGLAVFGGWVFLTASDRFVPQRTRGQVPMQALGGEVKVSRAITAQAFDWSAYSIFTWTREGDAVLDLTASPLLFVISGRNGVAFSDPLIPGSFADEVEELAYLAALERRPPALVLRPETAFDRRPERAIERTAPRVAAFVDAHYHEVGTRSGITVLVPKGVTQPPAQARAAD